MKMDARIDLDYIVENREYVNKLGAALDTKNVTVKKQVFELLSALCAHSNDGYSRTIDTLEYYKKLKGERYRLKIVVLELENAELIQYQIALLAFINCIIISTPNLQDRIRIRNEFIGLKVLPLLNNLRRGTSSYPELGVQIDVFEEQRECDEAQSLQGPDGLNLSSHLDVFYAILRQVADTPQEIPFLSILQHLLRIDPKEAISDIIWDTAETLVHRATLLEKHEDSIRLLRSPSVKAVSCQHCRFDLTSPAQRKQSISLTNNSPPLINISSPPPPPPPLIPPPPPPLAPPPPPPPSMNGNNGAPNPPPPAPPPNLSVNSNAFNRPRTPEQMIDPITRLPQQETPVPKSRMKTLNWNKIPPKKILSKPNMWSILANSHVNSPKADLDYPGLEVLFCQQTTQNGQGSPKLGRDSGGYDTLDRKTKKENSEITLLDGKRSLNINIFLKQFRTSNEDIIQLIQGGAHYDIGAEKLRGLLKILPEVDELDMLKQFDGDKNRLGNAEKFLMQLIQVPNYKLRIESMLLKEEFASNYNYLEPSKNSMIFAADDLMTNKLLHEVLYMVVKAGNFLNSGGYAGDAAGVKLSSLQKLTDIRANKPGINLIHFVASEADKKNKELLTFPEQLTALENASKISVEQLTNEISALDSRIKKIRLQIDNPKTDVDIKDQMVDFLSNAERDLSMLQLGMNEIEEQRLKLSEFFCEDPAQFKLEECYKIFQTFCEKFKQSVTENAKRLALADQQELRRKLREEQLANKRRQTGTPVSDSENSLILDASNYDLRSSPAMSRRKMGFNNSDQYSRKDSDGLSPDITPNGSLRRRRSRVLSEEDNDILLEFLRSSGQENSSRERKNIMTYGSLDRSLARRARSGTPAKKRPDLLNVDFGNDRERPSSPSPLAEIKRLLIQSSPVGSETGDNKLGDSREWQPTKIDSWLQANDSKQNEDNRTRSSERRRLAANINRRSYENDSENELRKLDPLPEEDKMMISSPKEKSRDDGKHVRRYSITDWKAASANQKPDVIGTIEAIEDAHHNPYQSSNHPQSPKDKSQWRKSNLNVSNSSEEFIEPSIHRNNIINSNSFHGSFRRQRSRDSNSSNTITPSPSLQSITEEDKRKNIIQQLGERDPTDHLKIYRRPSDCSSNNSLNNNNTFNLYDSNNSKSNETIPKTLSSPDEISNLNKFNHSNKQSIYIKTPDDILSSSLNSPSTITKTTPSSVSITSINSPIVPRRINRNRGGIIDDRIDIDSENIETPPVTRKNIVNTHCRKLAASISPSASASILAARVLQQSDSNKSTEDYHNENHKLLNNEQENHFDRYSPARRTRRYKRASEYSSGTEETNKICSDISNIIDGDKPIETLQLKQTNLVHSPPAPTKQDDEESRLKRWQDKLQQHRASLNENDIEDDKYYFSKKETIHTKPEKSERRFSSINEKDVQEAIKNLKSPTENKAFEKLWITNNDDSKISSGTCKNTNGMLKSTLSNHIELNDEGFEETQSLVSDTPSYGKESTTSSCNDIVVTKENDKGNTIGDSKKTKPIRMMSSDSQGSNDTSSMSKASSTSSYKPSLGTKLTRNQDLIKNGSIRGHPISNKTASPQSTRSPRRSNASSLTNSPIRKTDSASSLTRRVLNNTLNNVERSNSRSSLRSSRSSLNSGISTNTIKKMPSKLSNIIKRPLQQTISNRTPGSRSSSSSSSIGPNILNRKLPPTASSSTSSSPSHTKRSDLSNTSFKETLNNKNSRIQLKNQIPSSPLLSNSVSKQTQPQINSLKLQSQNSSNSNGIIDRKTGRTSGFMRPTAASSTKLLGARGK